MKLNGIPDNDVAVIQQRIQSCIRMLNEVRQRVFWACALWIDKLILDTSLKFPDLQSLLDEVIDNRSFIYTLGSLMYTGELGPTSSYKKSLKNQHPQDNLITSKPMNTSIRRQDLSH